MKIALCSSYVPFIHGGLRNIVEWLQTMLEEQGHHIERVYIPEVYQPDLIFQQMMAYRWMNLDSADRIICFRPQAHFIPHEHKILWFIHHIRSFYDLWDTPYRGFPDSAKYCGMRDALRQADNDALAEAKTIFTNSQIVSTRLQTYNNISSEVLYPPVFQSERFYCADFNDEIVYICRVEHHKRQHLLIEAMRYTKTPVKLRLAGTSSDPHYSELLTTNIMKNNLQGRISWDNRWISEDEKVNYLAHCLAAAYLPLDEDSYGYPSVEASHASKPILTTFDAGGVLELVQDGINGYITEASPEALAEAMDKFYLEGKKTQMMGKNAQHRLSELNISWSHVLTRLLS